MISTIHHGKFDSDGREFIDQVAFFRRDLRVELYREAPDERFKLRIAADLPQTMDPIEGRELSELLLTAANYAERYK